MTALPSPLTQSLPRRAFLQGVGAAMGLAALQPALGQSARRLDSSTLKGASELVRTKAASAVELTRACLERIETYNPMLNAFITVTREQALAAARALDAELQRGNWRGPLHGVPIALKDNMDTAGIRTTAASQLFEDRVPSEDSAIAKKLQDAGAILVGKTNLHEFAYGGSSSVSYFGPVRNPWALDRVPGGSSGGSAAAIAADLCFGAFGTDTAGSVRIPASYCGVVGFKPTYGRVSNRGVVPLSWTLDHVGPLSRTVEDAALLLQAIAGFDERDPASVDVAVPDYGLALGAPTANLRVGVPREPFFADLDPEIAEAVDGAIGVIRTLTASVKDVDIPAASGLREIMGLEAYAYHAQWLTASPEKYQAETRDRIKQLAEAATQRDYVEARRNCDLIRREIKNAFSTVDLLVTPTMAGPPSPIEPIAASAGLDPSRTRNTWPFDVTGLPAISVPCGFTAAGLPIGLQIAGAPFAEATVLALAHAYERATDWHTRLPKVAAG
jgi:aspartyl-tRNA(Asn)/glutamyl-tRNA(Gln) amidotransferase subunit A